MTVVGSLQSGLTGNHVMLFTKSMLDFISSIILASTLGIGVLLSAGFVFTFQGSKRSSRSGSRRISATMP
jgi:uncharacterized membrane protein YqgA involved in biofilm formation